MKNKSLIIIIVALVAVIAVAAILYPHLANNTDDPLKEPKSSATDNFSDESVLHTPSFNADDIRIFDRDGNEISLSSFAGKPIIVNFWATWCGYCVKEMPDFNDAYEKYGNKIHFLMVNTDDGIEKGEKFVNDKGYSFPVYYDLEHSAYVTYALTSLPRTVAIDKNGNIVYNQPGMLTADALQNIIDMIE